MSSFGSAANLIRCAGLIVLCGLSILTAGCGATPAADPLSEVQELVDVVQQTDSRCGFASGFVYRLDVTPVQTWEIVGRHLREITPKAAEQRRAAVTLGCLPDGSWASGRDSEIMITSPATAEANYRELFPFSYREVRCVFRLEKEGGKWKALAEPEVFEIEQFCPPDQ